MKEKKGLIVGILLVAMVVFLIILNNGSNKEIIGHKWKDAVGGYRTLEFYKNGTGKYIDYEINYSIDKEIIKISFESAGQVQNMEFKIDNDKIISENGEAIYVTEDNYENSYEDIRRDLVANTELLDLETLWYARQSNEAKAKLQYENKLFKVKVTVMNIGTDYFEYKVRTSAGYITSLKVYLSTEELAKLNNNQHITVLGQLANITSPSLFNAFISDGYTIAKSFDDTELKEKIEEFGGTGGDGNVS